MSMLPMVGPRGVSAGSPAGRFDSGARKALDDISSVVGSGGAVTATNHQPAQANRSRQRQTKRRARETPYRRRGIILDENTVTKSWFSFVIVLFRKKKN